MAEYKVVEKFISINGEGRKAGQITCFIRFQLCNLDCTYCDTKWANTMDSEYELMNEREITNWVISTGIKNVTITGGEPLLQKNIDILLKELINYGIEIEIETNGSVDISKIISLGEDNLIITLDYKLPSSGMENQMNLDNYKYLRKVDVVKFVIGSYEDLLKTEHIIKKYDLVERTNVYLSPVFGEIEPKEIVEFILDRRLNGVNIQLQMHKFIWDPEMRGV
ncbi:MAG: putative 7-carboxy-7-deazaguanine synthase QueE [Andreesenia angusta]|nr:putative 7-carboxy-7-deazaguanine synthase QueE [Andreesenia angusta]